MPTKRLTERINGSYVNGLKYVASMAPSRGGRHAIKRDVPLNCDISRLRWPRSCEHSSGMYVCGVLLSKTECNSFKF